MFTGDLMKHGFFSLIKFCDANLNILKFLSSQAWWFRLLAYINIMDYRNSAANVYELTKDIINTFALKKIYILLVLKQYSLPVAILR